MLVAKRQRNYAARSRTGCVTCRKRHVRCDEVKPTCTNCKTGGRFCSYPDLFVTTGSSGNTDDSSTASPVSVELLPAGEEPAMVQLLDLIPNQSFTGFPLELPPISRKLFHSFAQQRTPRIKSGGWHDSAVIHKALANPGNFHATVIMASIHGIWSGVSFEELNTAIQYHRLEACRWVSQQILDPKKAKSEATIATIATLALLEASFFDCIGFDMRLLDTHVAGMQKALKYKPGKTKDNSLQSLTRMIVKSIAEGPINVQWAPFTKLHRPIIEAIAYPRKIHRRWLTQPDWQYRSQAAGHEWRAELGQMGKPEGIRFFEVRSQTAYIMSSFYIFVRVPWSALSSYTLNWVLELLFGVIVKTEPGVFGNVSSYKSWEKQFSCLDVSAAAPEPFDPRDWFWMCIYCAAAVDSAIPRNKKEEAQKELYKKAIRQNLRRISDLLKLTSWDDAIKALQYVKWDTGFDGEARIKAIWQVAAFGDISDNSQDEEAVPV